MPARITTSEKYRQNIQQGLSGDIGKAEYNAALATFKSNFYPDTHAPEHLGAKFHFTFSDIESIVQASNIPENRAMVAIYHGLRRDGVDYYESYGLRIVRRADNPISPGSDFYELTPALDIQSGDFATHVFTGSGIQTISETVWRQRATAYGNEMLVRRKSTAATEKPVNQNDHDAKVVVFPWESEVKQVYEDNKASGDPHSDYRYVMCGFSTHWYRADDPNSEKFIGEEGIRHSVAFHIQQLVSGVWEDKLNEIVNNTVVFADKGLEYGNLCPPRCDSYMQR